MVEAIGTLVQGRRGNYLVYFPSYQYLNDTLQAFQIRNPSVPVLVQRPGMNRVLQAIGRVIRSESDRGVALLIDARFDELRYRRLFPAWWKFMKVRNSDALRETVANFWKRWPRFQH